MIVRCGACRTQFEVPGPGRFGCPACGSVNNVGGAVSAAPPGMPGTGSPPPPPPPPPPDPPSPRITCSECELSFIVGGVAVATCPNCGADVETGFEDPQGV
jgi:hypothetical protein